MRVAVLFQSVVLLTSTAAAMTPVEIKRDYGNAVVTITTYSAAEDALGLGSGFIVDPSGVIVTCYHVINGAYPAVVKLLNGASFQDIWVLGCDSVKDVAVIKVKGRNLPTVKLADTDSVEVGEHVVAIGNPRGLENTISDGLLSGVRDMDGYSLLQISAPISPGSSGGPVFNSAGQVVGIASMTLTESQNLNFCVPIKYARPFVDVEPSLTLEDFSRGARASMGPPNDVGPSLGRSRFLQACVNPVTQFYSIVNWLREQSKSDSSDEAMSGDLLVAKERVLRARARMEALVPPDQELGSIRAGYLDVMQRVADGYDVSASGYANLNRYGEDAGFAKFAAAREDIERKGGLTELLARVYLKSGRSPTDTARRLHAAFDSLPTCFSMAISFMAKADSGLSVLHCIAESSFIKQFGFFCDRWLPGIVVDSMIDGFPAKKAGLRSGDVIVAVEDTLPLRNMWDWDAFVAGHPVGAPFRLDFLRAGRRMQLLCTLARRPQ